MDENKTNLIIKKTSINENWVDEWLLKEKRFRRNCIILAPFTLFISLAFLPAFHLIEKTLNGHKIVLYPGIATYIIADGEIISKFYNRYDKHSVALLDGNDLVVRFEINKLHKNPIIEIKENIIEKNKEEFCIASSYRDIKKDKENNINNSNDSNIPYYLKDFSDEINTLYDGDSEQFEDDMENDVI